MNVSLRTNRPEYWNEIAEEVRLFCGVSEVAEACEPADLSLAVTLEERDGAFFACAQEAGGRTASATTRPEAPGALERKRQQKRALKTAAFRLLSELFPDATIPWGSLTGIRPTKLLRELAARHGMDEGVRLLGATFAVSDEKAALAARICRVQRPYIESVDVRRDVDVYIGIPFCRTRCLYCSFASEVAGKGEKLPAYLSALRQDIEAGAELVRASGRRVRALYVGGGTPTVLSAVQLDALLGWTRAAYGGFPDEVTVEAGRPDTITPEKLAVLRAHGVARISINPQTMNDDTLLRIGRGHDAAAVERCFGEARAAGFASINMDLIAGLPGEDEAAFARTLRRVVPLVGAAGGEAAQAQRQAQEQDQELFQAASSFAKVVWEAGDRPETERLPACDTQMVVWPEAPALSVAK